MERKGFAAIVIGLLACGLVVAAGAAVWAAAWGNEQRTELENVRGQLEMTQADERELRARAARLESELSDVRAALAEARATGNDDAEQAAGAQMFKQMMESLSGEDAPSDAAGADASPPGAQASVVDAASEAADGGEDGEEGGMFGNMDKEEMARMSAGMQMNMFYGDLLEQLELDPEIEAAVETLLREHLVDQMVAGMEAVEDGSLAEGEAPPSPFAADPELRADLAEVLTPQQLQEYDAYQEGLEGRVVRKGLDMQVGMMTSGLSPENREQMVDILAEEMMASGVTAGPRAGGADAQAAAMQRARDRLLVVMEPEQFERADRFFTQMDQMLETQRQMLENMQGDNAQD